MELLHNMLGLANGAEIAGATLTGKGVRLAIAAVAGVVSLALPETMDPALALVEFLLARSVG